MGKTTKKKGGPPAATKSADLGRKTTAIGERTARVPIAAKPAAAKQAVVAKKATVAKKAAVLSSPSASGKKAAAKGVTGKAGAAGSRGTAKKAGALVLAGGKASAADRARAESLLSEIARRKQSIAEDFYEIGIALRQLSKRPLYTALGYRSFEALLTARDVMGRTTAHRLISLVSSMSRDEALAYGQEKAAALLDYARATAEVDTPKTLVASGRLPDGKKVADASVRELKEAAKQARSKRAKPRKVGRPEERSPEHAAAIVEGRALAAWLKSRGAGKIPVEVVPLRGSYGLRVELTLDASARLREV